MGVSGNFGTVEMAAPSIGAQFTLPVSPRADADGVAADVPSSDRLVVQNSNLSLVVDDVRSTGDRIVKHVVDNGGFMVTTSYNRPEESPFATITLRIPSARLNETLEFFRAQAIKVTNENQVGEDITDQYVDIEARLETLEQVKAKFEGILGSATQVQDILTVQREIINTQTQIDNLKGQKKALEENASFSKVTVYLSTDELSLPYTPDDKFRPQVVFKLAVRSLLNTLRLVGEAAIWFVVYAVLWVPVVFIVIGYNRWQKKRQTK